MTENAAYKNIFNVDDDNLETFGLLWLDAAVNTSDENREAQQELRLSINHVKPFEEVNKCEKYIRSVSTYDRLVLIVSGKLGQVLVPRIHNLRQVTSIYVYCMQKSTYEEWAKNYVKVKAVTIKLADLIDKIKRDQSEQAKEDDLIVINTERSTNSLNGNFMHSLLLIDVLLRMTPVNTDKNELIDLCKIYYEGNKKQMNDLRYFEKNYSSEDALSWYTRETFLYKILNKALRVINIDILFCFRFFIRDLYQALKNNGCTSMVHVYRGQLMSNDELKMLENSVGELISINSFFSTSIYREEALRFMKRSTSSNDLQRVLFVIDADPNIQSTKPFANISSFSNIRHEAEVLFMSGSVFRLKKIQKQEDQYWLVSMTLCSDNHNLTDLFQYMKENYGGGENETSILLFGRVIYRMDEYDLAEKYYRRLLNELSNDDPSLITLYYSLGLVLKEKKQLDESLKCLNKSLKLLKKTSPNDYIRISMRYNLVGTIHRMKKDYDIALDWLHAGLKLLEQVDAAYYSKKAHFYNNIAIIYEKKERLHRSIRVQ